MTVSLILSGRSGGVDPAAIDASVDARAPAIAAAKAKATNVTARTTYYSDEWGFVDDGTTDNTAAWATLKAAIETNPALSQDRRARIVFRPSATGALYGYKFGSRIQLPNFTDIDAGAARFNYAGTDYSGPFLANGDGVSPNSGADCRWPAVYCSTLATHRCSALTATMDLDRFAGIAIRTSRSRHVIPKVEGFAIGVQIRPQDGGSLAYNTTEIDSVVDCRIYVDWFGVTSEGGSTSGWPNENAVPRLADGRCSSNFVNMGNAYAFRFTALRTPAWTTGETVTVGTRRSWTDRIYTATTAGTCGATAPTGTGTGINDGAVTWSYVASDGYTGHSGNSIRSGCIQLGTPKPWAGSTAGVLAGWQWMNAGMLYEAQNGGTTGATAPTHTTIGQIVSDGTINWKCLGLARRVPLWMRGAGGRMFVDLDRVEGYYGSPVLVTGSPKPPGVDTMWFGDGITVNIRGISALTLPPNMPLGADHGIEFQPDVETTVAMGACDARVNILSQPSDITDTLHPAHLSLLGTAGGTVWTGSHGWSFLPQTTANSTPSREVTVAADALMLCDDGIRVVGNPTILGAVTLFGPGSAAFRVEYGTSFDTTQKMRVGARPLGGLVDGGSGGNPALRTLAFSGRAKLLAGGTRSGSPLFVASGQTLSAPGDDYYGVTYWRNTPDCVGVFCGQWGGKVATQSIAMRSTITINRTSLGIPILRWYGTGRRACSAMPDRGRFPARGEVIEDTTGASNGWRVTTAGDLAKAWTSGETAVPSGALRVNGGNVYRLNITTATATVGSTAPTGTSLTADVSDGTQPWRYVGPVAVLTAA